MKQLIIKGFLLLTFIQANSDANEKENLLAQNFTLKNADDISFSLSDTPDKPTILCFLSQTPDTKIGRYWMDENHKWINNLRKIYANEITVVTIKDMTNVPKWMPKSLVRKKLKGEPNRILIDWTGSVCHQYQIDNYFTLHILDSEMNIVYSTSEAYDNYEFNKVCENTKTLFERKKK